MARATVDVSLRADIKDLVANLEKVQGVTKKEAKAMVREMKKGYDQQVKASKAAADAQIKNAKKSGKFSKEEAAKLTDIFQKSATEISSIFGVGVLGDLEGLFDISKQSAEKFGVGAIAAFTGIGVAAAITVTAISSYVANQRELTKEVLGTLEANRKFLAPEHLVMLEDLEQAVKNIDAAYEQMALVGLAEAATAQEDLLHRALLFKGMGTPQWLADTAAFITGPLDKGARQISETFNHVTATMEGTNGVIVESTGLVSGWGKEIADSAAIVRSSTKSTDDNTESTNENTAAHARNAAASKESSLRNAEAKRLSARIQADLNLEIGEGAKLETEAISALAAADQIRSKSATKQLDARGKLNESLDQQMATIQKSIDLNGENVISTDAVVQAMAAYNHQLDVLEQKETAAKLAETSAQVNLAAQSINQLAGAASAFAGLALDKFSEIAEAEAERFSTLQDQRVEARTQEIDDMLETGDITQAQADLKLSMMERNEQARADNHQNLNKDQRKAAKRAFAVGQAAALAGVVASGAQAYMALLASFAYLSVGAPAAALAITGPAVIAQTAVVLANKPPQFASGGMVAPDHRLISAQPGEAVVSRRGVAALGGPSGLSELNMGMGSGGSMTANIVIDRRIIGQAVADIVPSSMTRRSGRIAVYGG